MYLTQLRCQVHNPQTNEIHGDRVQTVDPGSRQRNNDPRGQDRQSGDILFDQILIPQQLRDNYVTDSAHIFDFAVAARGNDQTRASDYLPVYAEFVFVSDGDVDQPEAGGVRIVALLPDPEGREGQDPGAVETVTLENSGDEAVSLVGWKLRDRAGNEIALSGSIAASAERVISMTTFSMPLNNSGDDMELVDADGQVVDRVSYSGG